MAVYVTGDTHGEDVLKLHLLCDNHPELTRDDFVVIAGDFGAVWSEVTLDKKLKAFVELPCTVLFVDGNHENFDLLESFPVTRWHGGKVHKIRDNVIHLMRGQVFEICGKTFFTFGGATSIDKYRREEGVSWWPQELPTFAELDEGIANLKRYGNKVDYIITHSCGERALYYPPMRTRTTQFERQPENQMLAYFEDNVTFDHWYFGHYHMDGQLNDNMTVVYQAVIKVVD